MTRHATSASLALGTGLALPLEAVTETLAILGIRGSGKTNTAVVLTEELLAQGQQVAIVDPTDVWWGLKSSADGARDGFPIVVLGGRHGDLPLTAADGATIADVVVDERVSVILSLRHFESQADQRRLVTDFARRLYHRKGQAGGDTPLMVIIDEASLFVPQRVGGAEAAMVGAIQKLVRQGRASGLGVTLIDQRASTVNKDVLTQLELLIAHRTSSPQDRKALEAWIEQHDTADHRQAFLATLASLPRGTAWFWSPGWLDLFQRVEVRARQTFDSSRTPRAGERVMAPQALAQVDLEALRQKMASTIAQARADDPAELRKQLAAKDRELTTLRRDLAGQTVATELQAIEVPVLAPGDLGELERVSSELARVLGEADQVTARIRDAVIAARQLPGGVSGFTVDRLPPGAPQAVRARALPATAAARPAPHPAVAPTDPGRKLRKGALRMLEALARRHPAPTSWAQVAQLAGLARTGGTFSTYQSDLRTGGYVAEQGDTVQMTEAGWAAIGQAPGMLSPQTTEEMLQLYAGILRGGARRMIEELVRVHPRGYTREDLARAAGVASSGGTFSTYLSDLRKGGLIEERSGLISASSLLMHPGG